MSTYFFIFTTETGSLIKLLMRVKSGRVSSNPQFRQDQPHFQECNSRLQGRIAALYRILKARRILY
jgi:hypothetical protein